MDPVDLLIKIIHSKDNDMLFDDDMSEYIDYSRYNKAELIRISDALTEKIQILSNSKNIKTTKSKKIKKKLAKIPQSRY
jgi:hypothetical protein